MGSNTAFRSAKTERPSGMLDEEELAALRKSLQKAEEEFREEAVQAKKLTREEQHADDQYHEMHHEIVDFSDHLDAAVEQLMDEAHELDQAREAEVHAIEEGEAYTEETRSLEIDMMARVEELEAECDAEAMQLQDERRLYDEHKEEHGEQKQEATAARSGLMWQLQAYRHQHDHDVGELNEELVEVKSAMNREMQQLRSVEQVDQAAAERLHREQSTAESELRNVESAMIHLVEECQAHNVPVQLPDIHALHASGSHDDDDEPGTGSINPRRSI